MHNYCHHLLSWAQITEVKPVDVFSQENGNFVWHKFVICRSSRSWNIDKFRGQLYTILDGPPCYKNFRYSHLGTKTLCMASAKNPCLEAKHAFVQPWIFPLAQLLLIYLSRQTWWMGCTSMRHYVVILQPWPTAFNCWVSMLFVCPSVSW